MTKFILREAGLMSAFVVLGGLLLLVVWTSKHLNESLLREFKDTQISVILKADSEGEFRDWLEKSSHVVRYQILNPLENKDRLGTAYPELKNLLQPLDRKFFPPSALVTVSNADLFLKSLKSLSNVVDTQVVHEPPIQLKRFIEIMVFIFSGLWLMTLALVLYFNLERLAIMEDQKWSLMKMLGARPFPLFMKLWYGQVARVGLACALAVLLAVAAIRQIQSFFIWDWVNLSASIWMSFVLCALLLTSAISFVMFQSKFRRIPLG